MSKTIYTYPTKTCVRCKHELPLTAFWKDKSKKDGLCSWCNKCSSKSNKKYYKNNKDVVNQQHKLYNDNNKKVTSRIHEKYRNSEALYDKFSHHLTVVDNALKDDNGYLVVECRNSNCTNIFIPTNASVFDRIQSLKGNKDGENSFYCSNGCKESCEIFNFKPNQIDPNSKLFVPKSDKEEARRCQTDHLKRLQIDEVGYNYCEKCGNKGSVELHHTLEVAKHGKDSINSSGHLLLCKECHKEFTKQCR